MNFDNFMSVIWGFKAIPTDLFSDIIEYNINGDPPGAYHLFFPTDPVEKPTEHIGLGSDLNSIYMTNDTSVAVKKCMKTYSSFQEIHMKYFCYIFSENKNTYGFNKTLKTTNFGVIDDWFKRNSSDMGQVLLLNHLTVNDVLRPMFEDAKKSAAELNNKICNDVFINGFLVESQTAGSYLPGKILLLALKSLDRAGVNFQKTVALWSKHPNWGVFQDYDSYPWLDASQQSIGLNSKLYNSINAAVTRACKPNTVVAGPEDSILFEGTGIIIPNANMVAWVDNDDGPKSFGMRTGSASPVQTATGPAR